MTNSISRCLISGFFVGLGAASCPAVTVEGFTEPYLRVDISVTEPGTFETISVKQGEQVKAGAILAKLDTKILELTLAIAEQRATANGAIMEAQEILKEKQLLYQKIKSLHERDHSSVAELLRAHTEKQIAESKFMQVQEQQKLLCLERDRIQAQIDKRYTRAPYDGVISEVYRKVGESVLPSDARFVTIVQLHKLKAKFAVPSSQAVFLVTGQSVLLNFPEMQKETMAIVENVSPTIEAKSGTIEVTVVFDNQNQAFRSGARCLMNFPTAQSAATRNVSRQERND